MVFINYECHNTKAPYGTFGGAICMCDKCKKKRDYEESEIKASTLIKKCFCGGEALKHYSSIIFIGQDYGDRYPETVSRQNHGYQIRCEKCGLQTCWWHYEQEAVSAWNLTPNRVEKEYKDHEFCKAVDCLWSTCSGCSTDAKQCVYTAKEFHRWLKSNGYKIVKED